jgi:hypothetical protein
MILNSGSGSGIPNRGIVRDRRLWDRLGVASSRPYGTFRLSNLYPGLRPGLSSAVPAGLILQSVHTRSLAAESLPGLALGACRTGTSFLSHPEFSRTLPRHLALPNNPKKYSQHARVEMPSIRIYMSCIFRVRPIPAPRQPAIAPLSSADGIPTPPQTRHAVRSTLPRMISIGPFPTG